MIIGVNACDLLLSQLQNVSDVVARCERTTPRHARPTQPSRVSRVESDTLTQSARAAPRVRRRIFSSKSFSSSITNTMSKSPSLRRIQADVRELALDPSDRYHAAPLENDMFEWYVPEARERN
jgi:hypothetical protein